jgi:nucleoid-associated protein YgaU
MASSPRSVPASSPAAAQPAADRPVPARPVPARLEAGAGRGPQASAPATTRRDAVRPGARPARFEGVAGARPVRGGCSPEVIARPLAGAGRSPRLAAGSRPPLRLTRRGRRVVAGLSIAIGLTIAAVTAAVELAGGDGGLQLAGSSSVVVEPGDTLWSLAQTLTPEEDPRAVVDAIVDLNELDGVALVPGQVLQLP